MNRYTVTTHTTTIMVEVHTVTSTAPLDFEAIEAVIIGGKRPDGVAVELADAEERDGDMVIHEAINDETGEEL